jgi:hypothetical protein
VKYGAKLDQKYTKKSSERKADYPEEEKVVIGGHSEGEGDP